MALRSVAPSTGLCTLLLVSVGCKPDELSCDFTATCPPAPDETGGGGAGGTPTTSAMGGAGGAPAASGGGGSAALPNGKPCASAAECASAACVDGVCCESACALPCSSCNASGKEGSCVLAAPGTDPDDDCGPGVCDASGACAAGAHQWSKAFGDGADQSAAALAVDASGNIVLGGDFWSSVNFGGPSLSSLGYSDGFVARFNAAGGHLASVRVGETGSEAVLGVAIDSASQIVIGGSFGKSLTLVQTTLSSQSYGDIFLAGLSGGLTASWAERFGHSSFAGPPSLGAVAVAPQNDIVVAGSYPETIDFGGPTLPAPKGIFVARLTSTGKHVWSQRIGPWSGVLIMDLAVSTAGIIVVVGHTNGGTFGGPSLPPGAFIAAYDALGAHVWSKGFADAAGRAVAFSADGSVIVAGSMGANVDFGGGALPHGGAHDVFVAKFDGAGKHVWSRSFGDADFQYPLDVAVDEKGNVIVAGELAGAIDFGGGLLASAGGTDAFVVKLAPGGEHLWSRVFGSTQDQSAKRVAVDKTGAVVVAGDFATGISLGGALLTSAGGLDVFLGKLSP